MVTIVTNQTLPGTAADFNVLDYAATARAATTNPDAFAYTTPAPRGRSEVNGQGIGFEYDANGLLKAGTVRQLEIGSLREASGAGGPGFALSTTYRGLDATVADLSADAYLRDVLAGDDVITVNFEGRRDLAEGVVVRAGAGHDRVFEGVGTTFRSTTLNTIDLGAGNDRFTLTASDNNYRIVLGQGRDTVVIDASEPAGSGLRQVTDFDPREDRIVVTGGSATIEGTPNGGTVVLADGVVVLELAGASPDLLRVNANGVVSGDPVNRVVGTNGDDFIQGTDRIDRVSGLDGNDNIVTGDGTDVVAGGRGDDVIDLGAGDDAGFGSAGADTIYGGAGRDTIRGGVGGDTLYGGADADRLLGERGADVLFGGLGDDLLIGGDGADALFGEAGNDRLFGQNGDDSIDGGLGDDAINAGNGDDLVFGAEGNDRIDGRAGNDRLFGNDGDDLLAGGNGNDVLAGEAGDDRLVGGNGVDELDGGIGNDRLYAGAGDDFLFGDAGDDVLFGNEGDDTITAGAGDDFVDGGTGNDVIDLGAGRDVFRFGFGAGQDVVYGFTSGEDRLTFEDGGITREAFLANTVETHEGLVFDAGNGNVLLLAGVTFETFDVSADLLIG